MKLLFTFILALSATVLATDDVRTLEAAVDALAETKEVGYGYSSLFSGDSFLPRPDSSHARTLVIGASAPKESEAMKRLVANGPAAIPALVKHLDDSRPTKIPPVAGMTWMDWSDEYDFNRLTQSKPPKDVNRDSFNEQGHPNEHQITVGDLCFVALGQIVNRRFNATRYQPSGGMIVSSPTYSKRLLKVVRSEYEGMRRDEHRDQLILDFNQPDNEDRRNGAVMRLAFYYPDVLDDLVINQLRVPAFDVFAAEKFVRKVLYKLKTPEQRKEKLDAYLAANNPAAKEGLLRQLFSDLDLQIADEEGRLSRHLNGEYDARNVLIQLFGFKKSVTPKDAPIGKTWSESDKARFIESLGPASSQALVQELIAIFRSIKDDDSLALACMKALRGKGFDSELSSYCKRRMGKNRYAKDELKMMLSALQAGTSVKQEAK